MMPPPSVPQNLDPFDRPFLELALSRRADMLVSGGTGVFVTHQHVLDV